MLKTISFPLYSKAAAMIANSVLCEEVSTVGPRRTSGLGWTEGGYEQMERATKMLPGNIFFNTTGHEVYAWRGVTGALEVAINLRDDADATKVTCSNGKLANALKRWLLDNDLLYDKMLGLVKMAKKDTAYILRVNFLDVWPEEEVMSSGFKARIREGAEAMIAQLRGKKLSGFSKKAVDEFIGKPLNPFEQAIRGMKFTDIQDTWDKHGYPTFRTSSAAISREFAPSDFELRMDYRTKALAWMFF